MPPRKPRPGYSLAEKRPDLVPLWSPNNTCSPYEVFPQSNKPKRLWLCEEHGEYEQTCSNKYHGYGCKKCAVKRSGVEQSIAPYKESIGYLFPNLLSEWSCRNNTSINTVYPHSNKKFYWTCSKGHKDYLSRPNSRIKGTGCPICSRKSEKPALEYSLAYNRADLIFEWSTKNTDTPWEVYAHSSHKYWWKCLQGHEWESSCDSRVGKGSGCIQCYYSKLRSEHYKPELKNSLGYQNPELVSEWSPNNTCSPWEVYAGSDYRASWICEKGHEWEARVANRRGINSNKCPVCNPKKISIAEKNLYSALIFAGKSPSLETKIGKWSVDIYFPESKTIIEYDGSYYHSSLESYERDKRKSLELLSQGYKVIRVRTYSKYSKLSSLEIKDKNYIEISTPELGSSKPTLELVSEITSYLA